MPTHRMYLGTYCQPSLQAGFEVSAEKPVMGMTGPTGSVGIYVFDHDPETGDLTLISTAEAVNPSFLAFNADESRLFAVLETREFAGVAQGGVASFAIDPATGALSQLSETPSGGQNPCHLVVSPGQHQLAVANWQDAKLAILPIDDAGRLAAPVTIRQHEGIDPSGKRAPHAHFVTFDPTGRFLLTTDTGNDRVTVDRVDEATGALAPNDPPWGDVHPGGGLRHLAFHPNGRWLYGNGESSMTISVFEWNAETGALQEIQFASTVPEGTTGDLTTAQIQVHPNGKFVYVSNRGHSSIAVFAIDQQTGKVTRVADVDPGGRTPRNFAIDPSGTWMYIGLQNSDLITRFRIDPETGALTRDGDFALNFPTPVCLLFTRQ